jgi:hypothetical protein
MIQFFINNYDNGRWGPSDWDKYTNDVVSKEYVIDYMRTRYGDYPMIINYLTLRGHYIIDMYPSEVDSIRYYISDKNYTLHDIWIDRKILMRQVILENILENI